jgi:hypothetical protein
LGVDAGNVRDTDRIGIGVADAVHVRRAAVLGGGLIQAGCLVI